VNFLGTVRHALELARDRRFAEVEVQVGVARFSGRLEVRKSAPKRVAPAASSEPSAPTRIAIKSHHVGYFRAGASLPSAGESVKAHTPFGVISVLGLANDVEVPVDGVLDEVLVAPDQAVEFGQVLAWVVPA